MGYSLLNVGLLSEDRSCLNIKLDNVTGFITFGNGVLSGVALEIGALLELVLVYKL